MIFKDLYEKGLTRKVNPAVSASDLTDDTVMTEIVEYVFTEEIIINLFKVLTNIKNNQGSHVGIWINGYYGSGKSHFLKYTSYCLSKRYSDLAFIRLIEASEEINRNSNGLSKLDDSGVTISELKSLQNWYVNQAEVEMVMFNIGDVHDVNADQSTAFTTIFWNQFNEKRGFNSRNLALAQHLEKALFDDGKFDEFKEYVKSKGYDWQKHITRFAAGKLDMALDMAKTVDPSLATDVIRERIVHNDINVSVDAFADELKEYIDAKGNRNFRLLFFVDEVSQFIGTHRDLLLQLQSLVKRLDEVCESRVWIACTAQQTLEEVVTNSGGNATNPEDEVGKILGRFEVRASLQGTSPEYITQRRILEKKGEVEVTLFDLYEKDKPKLDAQFVLPTSYQTFHDKQEFANYYPFVPYQFKLIMKVLDSFVNMNYVDRQVRGNERSLINITYSIAQDTQNMKVGQFISFDKFYGAMFQGSLQHLGKRAFDNAEQALSTIKDPAKQEAYRRVVYVMFMICNLSDSDKQTFAATVDNIVTLLMDEIDENKAAIKHDVQTVINFLIDKAVIRKLKTDAGNEVYEFLSEEESKVAQLISNQTVDNNTYCDYLRDIFFKYLGNPANRVNYATRSFNVGASIDGRNYLSNNPDVSVDFITSADTDSPDQFAFSTNNTQMSNHLIFFLYPLLKENTDLLRSFREYCRVQRFAAEQQGASEERRRTVALFQQRANDMRKNEIEPAFHKILDTCPIVSCAHVLSSSVVGNTTKAERYKHLLDAHMETLYQYAKLVDNKDVPRTSNELQAKILRPVDAELFGQSLSIPEKKVKDMLDRTPHDVAVSDVVRQFARAPYGWSDLATIYYVNELVRRHHYAFNYNNNPDVSREETARNIVRDAAKFTIEKAKAISQYVLNNFIGAWKKIFNKVSVKGSNDSTELYRACKEAEDSDLNKLLANYRKLSHKINACPFQHTIEEAIVLMEDWSNIRDHLKFFNTIIDDQDKAAALFDTCMRINSFVNDQYENYSNLLKFLDENRDNFAFLSDEHKTTVTSLQAIKSDEEPWDRLPQYIKMRNTLRTQLNALTDQFKKEIKDRYTTVFDELEKYAEELKVDREKFAKRDGTILLKTSTTNLYALQAAINEVNEFREKQYASINAAVPVQPKPDDQQMSSQDSGQESATHKPVTRVRKVVHLDTHTTNPMRTEEDVDLYLQTLKEQLMKYIGGNNDIIVN